MVFKDVSWMDRIDEGINSLKGSNVCRLLDDTKISSHDVFYDTTPSVFYHKRKIVGVSEHHKFRVSRPRNLISRELTMEASGLTSTLAWIR